MLRVSVVQVYFDLAGLTGRGKIEGDNQRWADRLSYLGRRGILGRPDPRRGAPRHSGSPGSQQRSALGINRPAPSAETLQRIGF